MRQAMAEADVGDDHFGEDPTVRLLEEETARILGKESALFVPSGSMGNQIAIGIQTRRGDRVLLHERSHVAYSEEAALTSFLGLELLPVVGDAGRLAPESIAAALRAVRVQFLERLFLSARLERPAAAVEDAAIDRPRVVTLAVEQMKLSRRVGVPVGCVAGKNAARAGDAA